MSVNELKTCTLTIQGRFCIQSINQLDRIDRIDRYRQYLYMLIHLKKLPAGVYCEENIFSNKVLVHFVVKI